MSGWTTTRYGQERRYFSFDDLLEDGVPRCRSQSLPSGVDPIAQAFDGHCWHLLWSDGVILALNRAEGERLGRLPVVSMTALSHLGELRSTWQGDAPDATLDYELRAIAAQHFADEEEPLEHFDWQEAAPLHGRPCQRLGGPMSLLRVEGRRAACYLPSSPLSAAQLAHDLDHFDVWLCYLPAEGDPPDVLLRLPAGVGLADMNRTVAAFQRILDQEYGASGAPYPGAPPMSDFAELLCDFYGYERLPSGTLYHAELDYDHNWHQVACGLPLEVIAGEERPSVRRRLLECCTPDKMHELSASEQPKFEWYRVRRIVQLLFADEAQSKDRTAGASA